MALTQQSNPRRGFSLVEIMIVISIIAVLAAILIPNMARARQRTLLTTCEENVKSLATSFLLYQNDNQGLLPGAMDASTSYTAYCAPATLAAMAPYLRTRGGWPVCPSNGLTNYVYLLHRGDSSGQWFVVYCGNSGSNHGTLGVGDGFPLWMTGVATSAPYSSLKPGVNESW